MKEDIHLHMALIGDLVGLSCSISGQNRQDISAAWFPETLADTRALDHILLPSEDSVRHIKSKGFHERHAAELSNEEAMTAQHLESRRGITRILGPNSGVTSCYYIRIAEQAGVDQFQAAIGTHYFLDTVLLDRVLAYANLKSGSARSCF